MALHAVVLAGGSGTRFWPLSTGRRPKHLLALLGRRTLLEETAARLKGLVPPSRTVVVTAKEQAAEVRRLLPSVTVIAEPAARNTAAAVTVAAARIAKADPGATLIVVSADHWIPDGPGFRRTMAAAARRAEKASTLVLVGVRPDRPATGYGYLRPGKRTAPGVRAVARFTEKPDLATARRWLRARTHLWNAGLFAWRADAFLGEVRAHLPAHHRALSGGGTAGYGALKSISLDYGILEHSSRVEMVEASFRWDDLGSFAALFRHLPKDKAGNAARGRLVADAARGNLAVAPDGHLTAILGVEGLAVVTVEGVTLVVPLDRCEEIRRLVTALTM
jgi:mannose-1-phosphate guanylyltransferase